MPALRVIIGFDTEYQQADPAGLGRPNPLVFKGAPKRRGHKSREWRARQSFNDLLCYSVCVLNPETGERTTSMLAASRRASDGTHEFADWRKRLTLFGLVSAALAGGVGAGVIPPNEDGYQVVLAAHFTAADFPGLRDFEDLTQHKNRYFSAIRKTYVTLERPMKRTMRIPGIGHRIDISVRLVDTILWAPATHKSIAKLGADIGLPKIELPKGAIENMGALMASDPDLFEAYAIRDAEVAAEYALRFLTACRETFGQDRVPVTASSVGTKFFASKLKEHGQSLADLMGLDEDGEMTGHARDVVHLAAECFHGGRNETFWLGPTPKGVPLHDLDLAGCYPSCMALIGMPDYDAREFTTDLDRLAVIDERMAFARVSFEFPPEVRFPVLPVRGAEASGLFFPRKGVSYCTGPELVAARNLGAKITVENGIVVPWAGDFKPFLATLSALQEIRSSEKQAGRKGSVNERLAKEIANSLYGQTARAVSGMRKDGSASKGFDLYDGSRTELPEGRMSSAPCAAFITGMARATVGDLINSTPDDATVVSVTTDGFLSSVPLDAVDRSGPLMRAFTEGRRRVDPAEPALEEKHRAGRALSIRTRGVLSIEGDRTAPPLFARAGNKTDEDDLVMLAERNLDGIAHEWAENDYWIERAVERRHGDKVKRSRLTSIAEQWELRGGDLTRKSFEVSVALEFDFKRRILDPVTEWRGVFGAPTAAWETVAEAFDTRQRFRVWRNGERRVLKTARDLEDFRRYGQGLKPKGTRGRGTKTPKAVDALRWAAAHGLHDLPRIQPGRADLANGRWNVGSIAEALTAVGVPTSRWALGRLRARAKPPTDEAPDPENLSALKERIQEMETEMKQRTLCGLGHVHKDGGPKAPRNETYFSDKNQDDVGKIYNCAKFSYMGEGISHNSPPTLREVRQAAADLSVSRLKTDRAIAAYRKRLNGGASKDPVDIAIKALAVEAFGIGNTDGPALIRELIEINRSD